jgi:hypothetical protein
MNSASDQNADFFKNLLRGVNYTKHSVDVVAAVVKTATGCGGSQRGLM